MKCPECFSFNNSIVIDSRPKQIEQFSYIRRRRKCLDCEHRYTTYELVGENYHYFLNTLRKMSNISEQLINISQDFLAIEGMIPKADKWSNITKKGENK